MKKGCYCWYDIKAVNMTSHSRPEKQDVELQILTYLYDNPDAQDTLEGIVQWWLLERDIRRQYTLVRQALSDLINKDFVIEIKESNTQGRYIINKNKMKDIRLFLDEYLS
jgi:hypothetical protein